MKKKKLLFVGVFSKRSSNNLPQKEEFEKAGYDVTLFDYRINFSLSFYEKILWAFRRLPFSKYFNFLFYSTSSRLLLKKNLLKIVSKNEFDLIFLSKTEELDYRIIPELNKYSNTYYYFMDPLKTSRIIFADEYASRATFSSATFSEVVTQFKKKGANAKQIVQGIELKQFSEAKKVRKKYFDVIFAGTIDKKRKNFINYLTKHGVSVEVFGKGFKNGPIYNEDLMVEYARSKIILNLARNGTGFSVRVFEALGSGSLLLTSYVSDLNLYFSKENDLDWFSSKEECLFLIKWYLSNDSLRNEIARKGQSLVLKKFTWANQIKSIISFIEGKNE